MNRVVPFPVEFLPFDLQLGHFFIRDFDALLVGVLVQRRVNRQPFARSAVGNQVVNGVQADKRPTSPVVRNVTEHMVFDFAPLAGSGGQVTDGNGQPRFICQQIPLFYFTCEGCADLFVSVENVLIMELREVKGIFYCVFYLLAEPLVHADIEKTGCQDEKRKGRHDGDNE